jgi:hypothetical protein
MALEVTAVLTDPDLLFLPWNTALQDWPEETTVALPRGISRHIVRFVRVNNVVYAVKEVEGYYANREFRLLTDLSRRGVPCVEPVAVVDGREAEGESIAPALITAHLQFSLPYRALYSTTLRPDTARRLLDALAVLLVRLHLVGFQWGDCSLSNTLFRRDAGAFAAYLVDAETGELHERLTDGQRAYDLELAVTNVSGELMDLEAGGTLHPSVNPVDTGALLRDRYDRLWNELTQPIVFKPGDRWRVDEHVRRLNDMGFDIAEISVVSDAAGDRLVVTPKVVDAGHHARRLLRLTGLDVEENQARRLLNDLDSYRVSLGLPVVDEELVSHRWMTEVFEPVVSAVPRELRGKLEPAEIFHEVLEHRWFVSEREAADIGLEHAVELYLAEVLALKPDERAVLGGATSASEVKPSNSYDGMTS